MVSTLRVKAYSRTSYTKKRSKIFDQATAATVRNSWRPSTLSTNAQIVQVDLTKLPRSLVLGSVGIPGARGLHSWCVRLVHDRGGGLRMICRHKNVILIVTNR